MHFFTDKQRGHDNDDEGYGSHGVVVAIQCQDDIASMNIPRPSFRIARLSDIDIIVRLVNSAYRGDSSRQGWTTEADLLGGQRTDAEEIRHCIEQPGSALLLATRDESLMGSVHVQQRAAGAYMGMLSIQPGRQGQGLGTRFLTTVEHWVQQQWQARYLQITVISLRSELIAFYERRGFRATGRYLPFPTDPRYGIPKVKGLELLEMEKTLPTDSAAQQ